jgi:hypothetical protein
MASVTATTATQSNNRKVWELIRVTIDAQESATSGTATNRSRNIKTSIDVHTLTSQRIRIGTSANGVQTKVGQPSKWLCRSSRRVAAPIKNCREQCYLRGWSVLSIGSRQNESFGTPAGPSGAATARASSAEYWSRRTFVHGNGWEDLGF